MYRTTKDIRISNAKIELLGQQSFVTVQLLSSDVTGFAIRLSAANSSFARCHVTPKSQ